MIYLDNAATSMVKPESVHEAVQNAMRHCASIGRSGHTAARNAAEVAFRCRLLAGKLFELPPDRVVFTMHATHALNLAIFSLVQPGDRVVVSGFEHNAVMRPLQHLRASVVLAGRALFSQEKILEEMDHQIRPGTRAVICTHVSNVFGCVLPIAEIAELCRSRGIPLIVDASQSAGVLPVSMERLGAAFIAMPGHKSLYGPQGTGLLLCGEIPQPLLYGGTGSLSRSWEMPEELPDLAEAGTHNVPGIAGLAAGLEFVSRIGPEQICSHETALIRRLKEGLTELDRIRVFAGTEKQQVGVLSFLAEGMDCEILGERLSEAGFAVRAGLHCAPAAHESAGTLEVGTVRVSVSVFNQPWEIDRFLSSLQLIINS